MQFLKVNSGGNLLGDYRTFTGVVHRGVRIDLVLAIMTSLVLRQQYATRTGVGRNPTPPGEEEEEMRRRPRPR